MEVIVWGVGSYASKVISALREASVDVKYITDGCVNKSPVSGVQFIETSQLIRISFDKILIAISDSEVAKSVVDKCLSQGITADKILDLSRFTPMALIPMLSKQGLRHVTEACSHCNFKSGDENMPPLPSSYRYYQGLSIRHFYMAKLIKQLSRGKKNLRILELGSWLGESLTLWSEAILQSDCEQATITCVDLWDSFISSEDETSESNNAIVDMGALAKSGSAHEIFYKTKKYIKSKNSKIKVNCFRGFTVDFLKLAKPKYFDLIYIDASHYYEDVYLDIKFAKELVVEGGIICGDDLEVEACNSELLALCREHKRVDIIPYSNCVGYFHPGVSLAVSEHFDVVTNRYGMWAVEHMQDKFKPYQYEQSIDVLCPVIRQGDEQAKYEREFMMLSAEMVSLNK